jgi:hypothetical protein
MRTGQPAGGDGGGEDTGGSGGTNTGGSDSRPPATGGSGGGDTGGSSATGGSGGGDTGGSSATGGSGGGDTGGSSATGGSPGGPPASGQGPVADGKIVFSQDFEQNMDGMERSPGGLPEDRIQIVDDPIHQRGKVVRIMYKDGDNFRTSGGTEPRSWFSSAKGYTVKAGTSVSVAWGFMWENPNMGAHFAQIIRDGGPLWMFDVDTSGNMAAAVHRGSGGGKFSMLIQANKWYDLRVDTDYKAGGTITFYVNGQMIGQGKGDGGADGRFDCGIYWEHGPKAARTVYVSNVSIGER